MYNQLDLYYLKQMGIQPWVKKNAVSPIKKTVFLVVSPVKQNKKSHLLFNALLKFLRDTENNNLTVEVMTENDCEIPQIVSQARKKGAAAILSFGMNFGEQIDKADIDCPVISAFDLDYVINNPREKKMLYQQLLAIKALDAGNNGH